ncbi:MAG TPA: hypothetical protein VFQ42_03535 [Mycobacterium sp.]|nr:hypothetical protein [Mycobacterium sp.]
MHAGQAAMTMRDGLDQTDQLALRRMLVLAFLALLATSACSNKPTASELVQLQQDCPAAAKRKFEEYRDEATNDPKHPILVLTYKNYFSPTRQKCYVEISENDDFTVYDVRDNAIIGFYDRRSTVANGKTESHESCIFAGQSCNGLTQYHELAKSYLEQ